MATQTAANPLREKLLKGLAYQKSGEFEKAQRCYKQVLKKVPKNADALHLLGVTYRQLGFPKRALEYIQKAIEINPGQAPFYANLARTMMDIGSDPDSLVAVSKKALSLNPNETEALNIKGIALTTLEEWDEAEQTFETLIALRPGFGDAYQNFGLLLRKQKKFEQALTFFERAVEMLPNSAINYVGRARCRIELDQLKQSEEELTVALQKFPDDADLAHEFARLCFKNGEIDEGLPFIERALEYAPKDPDIHVTYGVMLHSNGRFGDATTALRRAADLFPASQRATAEWNLSLAYFANGQMEEGWDLHKSRLDANLATVIQRKFDVPEWEGEDIGKKSILVWNDQGIGDAIRNVSVVHDLCDRFENVILEAPVKLEPLFKRSFPEIVVRPSQFDRETLEATRDDFDTHCCISDLGFHLRRNVSDFEAARRPFLNFNREKSLEFIERLGPAADKPIVGVSWRSRNLAPARARWYLSITDFSPVIETEGVTFVNLQYAALEKELRWAKEAKGVTLHNWDDVDLMDDLDTAAALTACMDLVVSANTSVADLTGGLDVPCWRFGSISTVILLGQQNSPWYQSTKYYRIKPDQRAKDIVPDLADDLENWIKTADTTARRERLGL